MYKLFLIAILIFVKDSSANEIKAIASTSSEVISVSEAASIQFRETALTKVDPDTITRITCPLTINSPIWVMNAIKVVSNNLIP